MLWDRIHQPIQIDSTILYIGDNKIYEVEGLSAQKVRVRIRGNRISSIWPKNCLVIDENLWVMARLSADPTIMEDYWLFRRSLLENRE